MDVKKFSITESLKEADNRLQNSPSLLGMSALTYPSYINAMRGTMFTTHLTQFRVLCDPDVPKVFTNNENTVGALSNSYKKTKNRLKVFRKISKFDDIVDRPFVYKLFVLDEDTQTYDVLERSECKQLQQDFGYQYNDEVIDSYEEGDIIEPNTVLYKSSSYDEYMNYGYGKNVNVAYTLEPFTSEDAAVVSRSFCNSMKCIETEPILIGLNSNDYLINIYGDESNYKPLPDIGEFTDNILAVSRRQFNNQLLFDFKDKTLRSILDSDSIFSVNDNTQIIDYTIYNNNEELINNPFYSQINKYIISQNKYYSQIYDTCKTIMNSGKKYTREIDYLFKRSAQMLNKDTNQKWKIKDSMFDNILIEVKIKRISPLGKACKMTFRCGNKSVISQIREDEDMPYTHDGRRVDVLLNLLAIINRTTAFPLFEIYINGSSYQIRQKMKELKTIDEQAKLMIDYVRVLNEEQADYIQKKYDKMGKKAKQKLIDDAIEDGIYIHQTPMWEKIPLFYRCMNIKKKFPFIQTQDLYIKQWGREIKILNKYFVGEMYCLRLKQGDRNGFSARSTGAIDNKGLPVKSNKFKSHLESHSSSCIRFGEQETLNFSIGVLPADIALFHALYRTSIKGRKDLCKMMFSKDGIKSIDKKYTSRVAEVFNVILKSLGVSVDFINEDDEVKILNDEILVERKYKGKIIFCTDYQYYIMNKVDEIKDEIFKQNPILKTKDLNELIVREMKKRHYIEEDLDDVLSDKYKKELYKEIKEYVETKKKENKPKSKSTSKRKKKKEITIDDDLE